MNKMDAPAISQKVNGGGHLYEGSKYAHFSQITEHNKHLFPLFPQAIGTTITLKAGDCLFIPKKWWHWVKSYASEGDTPRCLSVNFWFPSEAKQEDQNSEPSDIPTPNLVIQQILPTDFSSSGIGMSAFFDGEQASGHTTYSTQKWKILGNKTIPMVISHAIDDWKAFENWTDDYLIEKIDPAIPEGLWLFLNEGACAKRISIADFIARYAPDRKQGTNQTNSQETYAYLITPSDYEPRKEKHNAKILDILKDDFHPPFPSEMVGTDANFWMNFGRIDTGLHYDDDDGVLCVVKGRKVVTLYPPSDSEFLYPYPLHPIKLKGYNRVFHYNLYVEMPIEITREAPNDQAPSMTMLTPNDQALGTTTPTPDGKTLVTSAQLLEVCLHHAPNVALVAQKLQAKFGAGRIVYGIKNMNGVVKYEFYFYGLDKLKRIVPNKGSYYASSECNQDFKIQETLADLYPNDKYDFRFLDKTNLCIWSIDLTEESVLDQSTPHLNLYYACEDSLNIPIILAEKTYHKDGSIKLRSISYTGRYDKILQNVNVFRLTCLSIGLVDHDIIRLINFMNTYLYKSEFISIFNKGTEVGLYFYGIAYQPFVDFLMRYDYPVGLITLVVDHPHEISQLKLEVGFHFNKAVGSTVEPTRSAFYGLF